MTIRKLGPLANWKLLETGQTLDMPGNRRGVKLRLISQDACAVNAYDMATGALTSLGTLNGLCEFHFAVEGQVQVSTTSAQDVFFSTDDGHVSAMEYDNEQFVTEMTRRTRNPEVELMMYIQQQNAERREQQMSVAMMALEQRLERQYGGNGAKHLDGDAGGEGGLPQSADGGAGAGAGGNSADAGAGGAKGAEKPAASPSASAQPSVSENAKVPAAAVAGK